MSLVSSLFKKILKHIGNFIPSATIFEIAAIALVAFGPVQRKGKKKEQRIHRRMSNRFPIPSIRHTRNVEYTVDCHSRVIDGFWRRPISAREEEISPCLFFARSIYTVQPCERDIRDSLVAHDTRRIVHRCTAT